MTVTVTEFRLARRGGFGDCHRVSVRRGPHDQRMIAIDQPILIELDLHPRATAEDLQHELGGGAPLATIRRWLSAHEGWLVVREAAGWRLSPQGESFLTALD
jgi:hypothetical protein